MPKTVIWHAYLGFNQQDKATTKQGKSPMPIQDIATHVKNNGWVEFNADEFAKSDIAKGMERYSNTGFAVKGYNPYAAPKANAKQSQAPAKPTPEPAQSARPQPSQSVSMLGEAVPPLHKEEQTHHQGAPLNRQEVGLLNSLMQSMPQNDQERIQTLFQVKDYDGIRKMIRDNTADEKINRNDIESAKNIAEILMSYPKAMQSAKGGARFSLSQLKNILVNGRLADINRMNNALATRLRENGEDPYKVIKAGKNTKVEPNLNDFLNTMSNKMVRRTHENTLNAKCKYKGQNMSKANRVEKMAASGERFEQRGKKFFGVTSEGDFKATRGEYNYYKYLTQHKNETAPKQEQNTAQPQQEAPKEKTPVNQQEKQSIENADDNTSKSNATNKTADNIDSNTKYDNTKSSVIVNEEDNISNGKEAMQRVIENHEDVSNAMYRDDVGSIDFVWGSPGKGKKFKGGYGVAHIIAKRNADFESGKSTVDGETTVKKLVEVIAKGKDVTMPNTTNNDTTNARMKIHYDGYTAVLSMSDRNTWLLTGWEDEKTAQKKEVSVNANGEGNGSTAATPNMPMRTRHAEETDTSSTSTVPQNQQNVKEKKSIIERKTQAKQQDSNSMRKELIEQAAANEDTWVNSKKSELHLEDDNDTVVKLTPQELKYYHDLIKKGVVGKPELYKKAPEDVGEMDDNVEMSKEQKQIYDESNGDRDMPNSDSESIEQEENVKENSDTTVGNKVGDSNEHAEQEPRAKYSRDAENQLDNQGEKADNEVEFEGDTPVAQKVFDTYLTDGIKQSTRDIISKQIGENIKDFEALRDPVQMDRAFADLPFVKKLRVEYNSNDIQNNERYKNRYAVRYEYARRCFINDNRIRQVIGQNDGNAKQIGMVGSSQETVSELNRTGKDVQQTDSGKSVAARLGEYKGIKEQFDKLIEQHSKEKQSRDVSAFSFAGNPLSEEALKAKAEFETPLDELEKVSRERLRKVERNIQDFGKRIGVPVHFVYHPDRGYRGVCIHNGGIYINLNSNVPARRIFMHEFTQHLLLYYIYRKIYLSLNKLAIYKS